MSTSDGHLRVFVKCFDREIDDLQVAQTLDQMWVLCLRQEVDRPGCLDHELDVLHFDLLTLLTC